MTRYQISGNGKELHHQEDLEKLVVVMVNLLLRLVMKFRGKLLLKIINHDKTNNQYNINYKYWGNDIPYFR